MFLALLAAAGCRSSAAPQAPAAPPPAQTAAAPATPAAAPPVDPYGTEAVLDRIHAIDQEEIDLGKAASTKSSSKLVKEFGKRMIKDHSRTDKEIESIAAKDKLALRDPSALTLPDAEKAKLKADQDQAGRLLSEPDAAFDHDYLQAMVDGHEEALQFLQAAESKSADAGVKALAKKMEKAVRAHEALARKDLQKLGGAKGSG
ncbi:MAG TPA: DUF4142 domain-containing protein [Myxococcales bacterium]|nr:DUF4142 domain-containing protein [Myxococcales bacterium]